ncbi:MAG: hypothetical protein F6K35_38765 [Okeania sp. SIO2H7]|nr:hypothetical protein [Okeania sp. SIO2H7]
MLKVLHQVDKGSPWFERCLFYSMERSPHLQTIKKPGFSKKPGFWHKKKAIAQKTFQAIKPDARVKHSDIKTFAF